MKIPKLPRINPAELARAVMSAGPVALVIPAAAAAGIAFVVHRRRKPPTVKLAEGVDLRSVLEGGGGPKLAGGFKVAAYKPPPEPGPWREDWTGLRTGGERGHVQRRPDGSYDLRWQNDGVWITREPARLMAFRGEGAPQRVEIHSRALDWPTAERWGEAMAGPVGVRVGGFGVRQWAVVNPWPRPKAGLYNCANTPGADAFKNLACGRTRMDRDAQDLQFQVHESLAVPGWYVARWEFGALAAAPSAEEAKAIGYDVISRVNTSGRPTP